MNKSLWSHGVHILVERKGQKPRKQTTCKCIGNDQAHKRDQEGKEQAILGRMELKASALPPEEGKDH